MIARKPPILVTIALANRMARIAWALMTRGGNYEALGIQNCCSASTAAGILRPGSSAKDGALNPRLYAYAGFHLCTNLIALARMPAMSKTQQATAYAQTPARTEIDSAIGP